MVTFPLELHQSRTGDAARVEDPEALAILSLTIWRIMLVRFLGAEFADFLGEDIVFGLR